MGGFTERKEMEKGEGREETASDDRKRREKRDTEKDRGRRERSRQSFAFERDRVLPALHTGVTQRCRGSALCLVLKGWGRVCLDANNHCYTVLRQLVLDHWHETFTLFYPQSFCFFFWTQLG